jgi:acyl-CoA synthetase (AMP-forming)/AMP-acid ligase II
MNPLSSSAGTPADFVRLLQWRAQQQSERLAYNFLDGRKLDGREVTYAELDRQARAIGAALLERGLEGQRAVLLFQPGLEYIFSIVGCWYAGVTAVPIYAPRVNASVERVRLVVADAEARVMLATASVLASLDGPEWDSLRQHGLQSLAVDTLAPGVEDTWRMPVISQDSLAVLQYTSGSTGSPKGVRLKHEHLITNSRMIERGMRNTPDSVGVVWLPPFHDMGLIGGILQPLYAGFPMHLMAPATFLQRPLRWLEAITRFGGTISAAPNFAYDLCVNRVKPEQLEELDLSTWRVAANGAEPVRDETMRRFSATFAPAGFDARACLPCYGMAETTLLVSAVPSFTGMHSVRASRAALGAGTLQPCDDGDIMLVSSGLADEELSVAIVDPYTGEPCVDGAVGEIWLSGATVADGYWAKPEATQDTFQARLPGSDANWLRSGDLGALLDGHIYVTGRIKDLIVIRGQNHYPQDIEASALAAHPAIRPHGAAAFAIDGVDGEGLGLVIELDRNWQASDLEQASLAVREAVASRHQLQPSSLVFVRTNSIPKTSSGKVQRLLARARLLAGDFEILEAEVDA